MLPWSSLYELTPRDIQVTQIQRVLQVGNLNNLLAGDSFEYSVPQDRLLLLQFATLYVGGAPGVTTIDQADIRLILTPGAEVILMGTRGLQFNRSVILGEQIANIPAAGSDNHSRALTMLNLWLWPGQVLQFNAAWSAPNGAHVGQWQFGGLLIPRGNAAF